MNNFKSHFVMHKRFRNGIFLLAIILIAAIAILFWFKTKDHSTVVFKELSKIQHEIDSLKRIKSNQENTYKLKPFNPNFITDYKGYLLGMSPEEIDRLKKYRDQDKWINSIADFKKVTQVSDSVLQKISPLFKFPDWVTKKKKKKTSIRPSIVQKSFDKKKNLNEVTSEELQNEFNIPDFIAERIIKYRIKLDGFVADIQLKDVKGLYKNQYHKILANYTVKNPKTIHKVNINTATVKELTNTPYIDFETALEIRDLIKSQGRISSFDELEKIHGFSLDKIDRIALYLEIE